jgi:hypothetical protein
MVRILERQQAQAELECQSIGLDPTKLETEIRKYCVDYTVDQYVKALF